VNAGELPLDNPNWRPIKEAIDFVEGRTGSETLTAEELNQALQGKDPQGRPLRSLLRQEKGVRKLLNAATWKDDLYLNVCFYPWGLRSGGIQVFSRAQGTNLLYGGWVFVWWPDVERLWPSAASELPPERRQRRIAEAIIQRLHPDNANNIPTATLEQEIKGHWADECRRLLIDPSSENPPSWQTVNRMMGRSK